MKRKIAVLITTFLISLGSYAQKDAAVVKTMLEQANDMGKKFMAKDYAGFLKYTHPATIKVMGGEKAMLDKTSQELKEIEKEGISIISVTFGAPSKIIKVDKELQCTLPQIMEMRIPGGKITAVTTMIALSPDMGKNWYFLDTSGNNLSDMKMLLPTLSNELYIPMPSDPSFEADVKEEVKTE